MCLEWEPPQKWYPNNTQVCSVAYIPLGPISYRAALIKFAAQPTNPFLFDGPNYCCWPLHLWHATVQKALRRHTLRAAIRDLTCDVQPQEKGTVALLFPVRAL